MITIRPTTRARIEIVDTGGGSGADRLIVLRHQPGRHRSRSTRPAAARSASASSRPSTSRHDVRHLPRRRARRGLHARRRRPRALQRHRRRSPSSTSAPATTRSSIGTVPLIPDTGNRTLEFPDGVPVADTENMTNGNTRAAVRARRRPERPLRGQPQPRQALPARRRRQRPLPAQDVPRPEGEPGQPGRGHEPRQPVRRHRRRTATTTCRTRRSSSTAAPASTRSSSSARRSATRSSSPTTTSPAPAGSSPSPTSRPSRSTAPAAPTRSTSSRPATSSRRSITGGSGDDTIHVGGDPPTLVFDPPPFTYTPPPFTVALPPELVWTNHAFNLDGFTFTVSPGRVARARRPADPDQPGRRARPPARRSLGRFLDHLRSVLSRFYQLPRGRRRPSVGTISARLRCDFFFRFLFSPQIEITVDRPAAALPDRPLRAALEDRPAARRSPSTRCRSRFDAGAQPRRVDRILNRLTIRGGDQFEAAGDR